MEDKINYLNEFRKVRNGAGEYWRDTSIPRKDRIEVFQVLGGRSNYKLRSKFDRLNAFIEYLSEYYFEAGEFVNLIEYAEVVYSENTVRYSEDTKEFTFDYMPEYEDDDIRMAEKDKLIEIILSEGVIGFIFE